MPSWWGTLRPAIQRKLQLNGVDSPDYRRFWPPGRGVSPDYRISGRPSVRLGQGHPELRRPAAHQALPRRLRLRVDGADRHPARLGLDPALLLAVATPLGPHEPALVPEVGDHLVQRAQLVRAVTLKLLRALVDTALEVVELLAQAL